MQTTKDNLVVIVHKCTSIDSVPVCSTGEQLGVLQSFKSLNQGPFYKGIYYLTYRKDIKHNTHMITLVLLSFFSSLNVNKY